VDAEGEAIVTRSIVLLGFAAVLLTGCSAAHTLDIGDDGTRLSLAEGDKVTVTLEGNATTGYTWELVDYDPEVITPRGEPTYEAADTELVGGGGTWTWTLIAAEPGECSVGFVYHRPWEEVPPLGAFSFIATVGD
jgi:inhibitor of cysteine peptidase